MSDLAAKMKQTWETTATRNAHLGLDGEEPMLMARYHALVTDRLDVSNKVVVDFGMGGGLLGKHLFSLRPKSRRPSKYIGYDIADRSIERAHEVLWGLPWAPTTRMDDHVKLIKIERHRWSFAEEHPDVIVCLACIIHFPTEVYLKNVLHEMDISGAKHLVLEIRNKGKGNEFQQSPYSTSKKTLLACNTSPAFVSKTLPHFVQVHSTEPSGVTGLQVLWYTNLLEVSK